MNQTLMLKEVSFALTKTGSSYARGTVAVPGGQVIPFKCWGASQDSFPFQGGDIVSADAREEVYQGTKSLVLEHVNPAEGNRLDFMPENPNKDEDWARLRKLVKDVAGDLELFDLLVTPIIERFQQEVASVAPIHDYQTGGLLRHSMKVTLYLAYATRLNPVLLQACNPVVLITGAALHDLGKVFEYNLGTRAPFHWVGHRTLGVEYIVQRKDQVVALVGEEGYHRLLTIVAQHHGDYEERPRTVEAALVHFADSFDTHVTAIAHRIEDGDQPIQWNGWKLS